MNVRVLALVLAVVLCGTMIMGCRGPAETEAPTAGIPFEATADKELETAIRKASPSYTRDIVDADSEYSRARYVLSRYDLNGDGRDEVFVYLLGSIFCGTGGCNLLLFTPGEAGYSLVSEFPISRTPIIISTSSTEGWRDIVKPESGGGAPLSYVRYVFDGTQYVERGRSDAAPDGTSVLAGELSLDKGVPLEPGDAAVAQAAEAPPPSAFGFSTVCGVTVDGKDYRYRCTVEGAAAGEDGETVLSFPDNTVTITWLGGDKAMATFAGMVPREITVATADGVTRFPFEDKVYFYTSDRAKAAAEIERLP
jgi:hypothetical protein